MIITGYIILMAFFIQTEMIIIHLFLMTAKFGEFEKKNIDDFDHPNKQIFSLLFISLITSYFMIIVVGGMTIGTAVISLNLLTMVFLSKLIKKENIDILLSNS